MITDSSEFLVEFVVVVVDVDVVVGVVVVVVVVFNDEMNASLKSDVGDPDG